MSQGSRQQLFIPREIKKVYCYSALNGFAFGLILPVWFLYHQESGLTVFQATLLQGLVTFGMLPLEIPAGVLADIIGGKRSLIGSTLFLIFHEILMIFWPGIFWIQAIGYLCAGFGYALFTGTVEALLYKNIEEKKLQPFSTRIFGLSSALAGWASIIGMTIGGGISEASMRAVFIISALVRVAALIAVLSLKKNHKNSIDATKGKRNSSHILEYFRSLCEHKKNAIFFVCSSFILGIFLLFNSLGQRVLADVKFSFYQIGLIFSLSKALGGFASTIAHKIEDKFQKNGKKIFLYLTSIMFLAFFGFLTRNPLLYIISFVTINFVFYLLDPITTRILNEKIADQYRTAMLSTYSFVSSVFMTLLTPLLGYLAMAGNYHFGFYLAVLSVATLLGSIAAVWLFITKNHNI